VRAFASAQDLADQLQYAGCLADEGLATTGLLARRLNRPRLLEGEPGTDKTADRLLAGHSLSSLEAVTWELARA
jgi:MoxR-like ATPase